MPDPGLVPDGAKCEANKVKKDPVSSHAVLLKHGPWNSSVPQRAEGFEYFWCSCSLFAFHFFRQF